MSARVPAHVVGAWHFGAGTMAGLQLFVDVGGRGPRYRSVVEAHNSVEAQQLLYAIGWSGQLRDGRLFDLPQTVLADVVTDVAGRTSILSLHPHAAEVTQ